jgi:hypothetical protein
MSAICQISPRSAGSAAPLAFRPTPGLIETLAAFAPVATARLGVQRLLAAFRGTGRKRPAGGPGEPPEDHAISDSPWDDPALWMLMMH